jgi:hypothetical protein
VCTPLGVCWLWQEWGSIAYTERPWGRECSVRVLDGFPLLVDGVFAASAREEHTLPCRRDQCAGKRAPHSPLKFKLSLLPSPGTIPPDSTPARPPVPTRCPSAHPRTLPSAPPAAPHCPARCFCHSHRPPPGSLLPHCFSLSLIQRILPRSSTAWTCESCRTPAEIPSSWPSHNQSPLSHPTAPRRTMLQQPCPYSECEEANGSTAV